jgi:hypothetical protein
LEIQLNKILDKIYSVFITIFEILNVSDNKQPKLSIREIALRGTIIATIITVPSIVTFLLIWIVLDNLIYAAILGAVVHFIAMGFSLKISKKMLVKK